MLLVLCVDHNITVQAKRNPAEVLRSAWCIGHVLSEGLNVCLATEEFVWWQAMGAKHSVRGADFPVSWNLETSKIISYI